MSIGISAGLPGVGRLAKADIATPQERHTDEAMAAQDGATETISQGLAPKRSQLDRLLDEPSVLDRFAR